MGWRLTALPALAVFGLVAAPAATARTIRLGWTERTAAPYYGYAAMVNGADPFSWTTQREFRL